MRVLMIHNYYAYSGGEDAVFRNECALLREHSIKTTVFEFHNRKSRLGKLIALLLSPFNFFSYWKISRYLDEYPVDLVHVHNWHFAASPAIILAAKNKGIPVVHTLHNHRLLCPSAMLFHKRKIYLKSLGKRFPWKAVFDRIYRNSFIQTLIVAFTVWLHKILGTWKKVDRYITLSPFARNLILQSGLGIDPSKIVMKPNFTDDRGFEENAGNRSGFLFVGRLSEEKGIDILLNAAASAGVHLTIAGDGPMNEMVKSFEASHQSISYLGRQSQEEVIDLLKSHSAVILPSTCYEGMPMIVLEAFSTGTPVIATGLGAMPDIITEGYNGWLVEAANSKALENKLKSFEQLSLDEKSRLSGNARNTYEQLYTPEANLQKILAIYRQVTQPSVLPVKKLLAKSIL